MYPQSLQRYRVMSFEAFFAADFFTAFFFTTLAPFLTVLVFFAAVADFFTAVVTVFFFATAGLVARFAPLRFFCFATFAMNISPTRSLPLNDGNANPLNWKMESAG